MPKDYTPIEKILPKDYLGNEPEIIPVQNEKLDIVGQANQVETYQNFTEEVPEYSDVEPDINYDHIIENDGNYYIEKIKKYIKIIFILTVLFLIMTSNFGNMFFENYLPSLNTANSISGATGINIRGRILQGVVISIAFLLLSMIIEN